MLILSYRKKKKWAHILIQAGITRALKSEKVQFEEVANVHCLHQLGEKKNSFSFGITCSKWAIQTEFS